jgi:hypothetical protein
MAGVVTPTLSESPLLERSEKVMVTTTMRHVEGDYQGVRGPHPQVQDHQFSLGTIGQSKVQNPELETTT